jgi:ligand-binding sensor domain-containing protein
MMKKFIFLFLTIIVQQCWSQSLTGWTHYYAPAYGNMNIGNSVANAGPEEVVLLDKSTLAYTRYDFPSDFRQINIHNSSYTSGIFTYSCLPYITNGPGASVIVKGCHNSYQFDGTSYTPIVNYLGYPIDSIYFLSNIGGSDFFVSTDHKLHKYDGTTHTIFDSSNSPYDPSYYFSVYAAINDDIFMPSAYGIQLYHSGTWLLYDTTFFGQHYINVQALSTSPTSDFTFFNPYDTAIHTYINATATWTSMNLPSAMVHNSSYIYITSTMYDITGSLWIAGDSIFCRFDGSSFYDYFPSIATYGAMLNYITLSSPLASNKILFNDYYHNYIFDASTLTTIKHDDPHAVLSGNQLLPSLKDNNGNLWFGAATYGQENGLMKYDSIWHILPITNYTMPSYFYGGIFTIKQDTGNAIVFGGGDISSNGPILVNDTTISELDPSHVFDKPVYDLAIDQNHHYWYGGIGAGASLGLAEYDGISISFHNNFTSSESVYTVDIDSLDNKWVGYSSFDGIYKYDGSTWINYAMGTSPLPNDTVYKIIKQPNTNNMWFCTANGFAELSSGVWTIYNTSNTPLPSNVAEYVYFADDGSTWFATQNGFASLNGTTWEVYTTANSQLHNSDIESILLDNDCNVWIATENGLSFVHNQCASSHGKNISGNVFHPSNIPADNTLIYIYKLNSTGTDVEQIENVYTDNVGKFYYTVQDTGVYFFQAVVNPALFPGEITSYEDSSVVIQQSAQLHISGDGNFNTNIWLKGSQSLAGSCYFKGKLVSSTERVGSVRIVLMNGGNPIASVLSNFDGSFQFNNLAVSTYTLWIDKYGFNNTTAPFAIVDCINDATIFPYILYPNQLVSAVNNISENANALSIYPNPASENIIIRYVSTSKNVVVKMYDVTGQLVRSTTNIVSGENTVNISALAKGLYLLSVQDGTTTITKRFIKQ